jgi:hypothetical protein
MSLTDSARHTIDIGTRTVSARYIAFAEWKMLINVLNIRFEVLTAVVMRRNTSPPSSGSKEQDQQETSVNVG